MNQNTTPRPKHSAGSSQAGKAVKRARRDEAAGQTGDDGQKLMTAEEHRQLKMMEALNERAKIERLRKEAHERWQSERKHKYE